MGRLPLVSVVVTGYARPGALRTTVESLLATVSYGNLELVLADDASPPSMQEEMRTLPFDRFVFAEHNRGLGSNTNAGLAAATGEFVLQLQDDWECSGPSDFLEQGVALLESNPELGVVRFMKPEPHIPYETTTTSAGAQVRVYVPQPGSGWYVFNDWPHLKSRAFIEFLGPYRVSRYMQRTENDIRDRFNAQSRYALAYIEGYELFGHIGKEATHRKPLPAARIGRFMDRLPLLRALAKAYRRNRGA